MVRLAGGVASYGLRLKLEAGDDLGAKLSINEDYSLVAELS